MGNNKINNILIPNVSKLPKHKNVDVRNKLEKSVKDSEFKKVLHGQLEESKDSSLGDHGIKLSSHAAKRIKERNLSVDGEEFFKLKDAMNKLKEKGGRDSLVITNNAAYIVDVTNNKIVTALDKEDMAENLFTKIDSTLFVN